MRGKPRGFSEKSKGGIKNRRVTLKQTFVLLHITCFLVLDLGGGESEKERVGCLASEARTDELYFDRGRVSREK